jgi:acyl-CoA thioester hydrolase
MNEDRKLAYVERIPIRWGDMDAMGHVNNTVYFRYMEQTRISWFDRLLPHRDVSKGTGIVVASTSCNFRRPMGYPGTVEVKLFTESPGASSVTTYYELRVNDDPQLFADGTAVVVFIDPHTKKPSRIPDAIRNLIKEGTQ